LFSSSSSNSGEQEATTLLSVEVLADKLANAEFSSIIALVGAGASCSAGIPDFRTPGTGLYDKLGKYDLPVPEAIFDLDYYTKTTPLPFVDLCHSIWPGQETGPKPTPTHHFLKLLEEKQLLGRIYTQNIDGLEALAGISTDKLVECHGHFRSASCVNRKCKHKMPIEDCRKAMVGEGNAPVCQKCGSLVKPDIVFFGEEMPSRFQELIDKDMDHCDLLLVFGTSLLVMPVAGIPSWVAPICPRVLFNLEPAWGIGIGGGRGRRQQRDDLFLQGDCDDSVQTVCDLAGWKEDLETITPLRATSN
jgi:NAD-dependent SIR2 family protein deacetylase